MKTNADSETEKQLTEGKQVNEAQHTKARGPTAHLAAGRGTLGNLVRCLCLLLFNPARAAVLAAALAPLPAAAQTQAIEAWVQRYDEHLNPYDLAVAIAVDAGGNVVVTGQAGAAYSSDYLTVKYSSAGALLWARTYSGGSANAVAVDAGANVFVTGGADGDYTTLMYSGDGVPLWTNLYNGPANGYDTPTSLAVDTNGDVIVTGYSTGSGSGWDYATIKYSSAGVPLWTQRYNGPGNREDLAYAVTVGATGNVYVTGTAWGTSESGWATIAYSSAGVPLWTNLYRGGEARAVAVDAGGNVVVTGYSPSGGTANDYVTIKYSSAGVPLWTNRYNGPDNGEDWAYAVGVDAVGRVYVTGTSTGTGGRADYATIAYSGTGVPLWTNCYNGPADDDDQTRALAVSAGGNVYVTGTSWAANGYSDYATVAYSSAGALLWTNRYDGPANNEDRGKAVAVDASGNVYVTGYSMGNATGHDFATVKYAPPAITITRQPQSRTNALGTTASFSIEAMGGLPLSYQWRRQGTNLVDGLNISGVTTTNLQIASVQLADAAGYSVVITNAYGSTTSSVAQLTVINPGRFTDLSYSKATGFSCIFRDATVGQPYRLQRSSSLAEGSWTNWQTFTYTEPVGLMDVGATGVERRYYRAVSP
jgi:hypothetical protein